MKFGLDNKRENYLTANALDRVKFYHLNLALHLSSLLIALAH